MPSRDEQYEIAVLADSLRNPSHLLCLGKIKVSSSTAFLLTVIRDRPGIAGAAGLEAAAAIALGESDPRRADILRLAQRVDAMTISELAAIGSQRTIVESLREAA